MTYTIFETVIQRELSIHRILKASPIVHVGSMSQPASMISGVIINDNTTKSELIMSIPLAFESAAGVLAGAGVEISVFAGAAGTSAKDILIRPY